MGTNIQAEKKPHILYDIQNFFLVRVSQKLHNSLLVGGEGGVTSPFDLNPNNRTTSATKLGCKCL